MNHTLVSRSHNSRVHVAALDFLAHFLSHIVLPSPNYECRSGQQPAGNERRRCERWREFRSRAVEPCRLSNECCTRWILLRSSRKLCGSPIRVGGMLGRRPECFRVSIESTHSSHLRWLELRGRCEAGCRGSWRQRCQRTGIVAQD